MLLGACPKPLHPSLLAPPSCWMCPFSLLHPSWLLFLLQVAGAPPGQPCSCQIRPRHSQARAEPTELEWGCLSCARAHESATAHGQSGLQLAFHLTIGISRVCRNLGVITPTTKFIASLRPVLHLSVHEHLIYVSLNLFRDRSSRTLGVCARLAKAYLENPGDVD